MTNPTSEKPPNVLHFEITFLTPFRVSTGEAAPGVDATIDLENPLPATSLKGVMRATASKLLGEEAPIIGQVFGSDEHPCPWHWSDARPVGGQWADRSVTARLKIDPDTHTATRDMLVLAEEIFAPRAAFDIRVTERLEPDRLTLQCIVLAIAGRATRSLGAARRRGLGWVSLSCPAVELSPGALRTFLAQRQR